LPAVPVLACGLALIVAKPQQNFSALQKITIVG
jgi:hypothetical protein